MIQATLDSVINNIGPLPDLVVSHILQSLLNNYLTELDNIYDIAMRPVATMPSLNDTEAFRASIEVSISGVIPKENGLINRTRVNITESLNNFADYLCDIRIKLDKKQVPYFPSGDFNLNAILTQIGHARDLTMEFTQKWNDHFTYVENADNKLRLEWTEYIPTYNLETLFSLIITDVTHWTENSESFDLQGMFSLIEIDVDHWTENSESFNLDTLFDQGSQCVEEDWMESTESFGLDTLFDEDTQSTESSSTKEDWMESTESFGLDTLFGENQS